jgi:hypothetical protein
LIVAFMATGNLSDTDIRVRKMAKWRYRAVQDTGGGDRCKLTGKVFFVDALAAILGSERLAAQVRMITAFREASGAARIDFDPESNKPPTPMGERSHFGRGEFYPDHLLVEATLYGHTVQRIEGDLRKAQQDGS